MKTQATPVRKAPKEVIRLLKTLRKNASLENAHFTKFKIPGLLEMEFPFQMPCTTEELSKAVKESCRIHRESWILPLIDDLIAWSVGEKELHEIDFWS